ncbi:hypothetical protein [Hymenobacter terrenus]|uniref:hypothetical protein n=1 Tax=Hymenobacter terrenus TaxID=1629124 RepID=UPI0006199F6A|nr:hypothetical protein [Hymenobacter terrenus]
MATTKKAHYVANEHFQEYEQIDSLPDAEDRHAEYEEIFSQDEEPVLPIIPVPPAAQSFAYSVGHRVLPEPSAPVRTIIWRGQLKERLPETGLVHRVNVYRLDDGFWDCYREDELQAA